MTLARWRIFALPALSLFSILLAALLVSAPASADAPTQMPAQVVDAADVLTVDEEEEITAATERLATDKDLQLSVIYVHDFGDLSPTDWGRATQQLSEMSYRDLLLAVAVDDRSFYLGSAEPIDDLPAATLNDIADTAVAPAVRDGRWTEAAMTTVDELNGSRSRTWLYVTIAVLVLAALACLLAAYVYRRTRPRAAENDADDDSDLTVDELTAQPIAVLEPWSTEALVRCDNTVSISGDELALAEEEFGEEVTAAFRDTLTTAESAVATSFRLRHQLDHQPDMIDDERRTLLVQIISMCSDADDLLDRQVGEFDAMRDLLADASARLDALDQRAATLAEQQRRAPGDEANLRERFTGPIADSVAGNPALAADLLQFAADSVAQGREAVADEAERRQPTVAAIRSAECALDAAAKLLDALGDVGQNLSLIADGADGPEVTTAYVAAAESFIDTRRGAVGSRARACLSEAERLLDEARSPAETAAVSDRVRALATAALSYGAQDVDEWRSDQPGDGTAVLTGVLVDSVLAADSESALLEDLGNGGFSSGGRSPGSFGGSDTSGRIGTGGRG